MSGAATTLTIACACGGMRLVAERLEPGSTNRVVCACGSCQRFARRMGHAEILDAGGGTERFQLNPAVVRFAAGRSKLACAQQTRGGGLRWYATCCRAPMALTLPDLRVPFLAIDVARVEGGSDLEPVLGPVRARVNTGLRGSAARAERAGAWALCGMLLHFAPLLLRWWWRGDARRSPLLDAGGGPAVPVTLLPDDGG